jgi:hypothetical protein
MRAASLIVAVLLLPDVAAAQERVAVNLHVTIPDFLSVTVERETVTADTEGVVTRQIELRVSANRTWSLLVGCEVQGTPSEDSAGDGHPTSENPTPAARVRWRNAGFDSQLLDCTGPQLTRAAQGSRGDDRVVLEVVAPPSRTGALTYALIPR